MKPIKQRKQKTNTSCKQQLPYVSSYSSLNVEINNEKAITILPAKEARNYHSRLNFMAGGYRQADVLFSSQTKCSSESLIVLIFVVAELER